MLRVFLCRSQPTLGVESCGEVPLVRAMEVEHSFWVIRAPAGLTPAGRSAWLDGTFGGLRLHHLWLPSVPRGPTPGGQGLLDVGNDFFTVTLFYRGTCGRNKKFAILTTFLCTVQ